MLKRFLKGQFSIVIYLVIIGIIILQPAFSKDEFNTFIYSQVDPYIYERLSEMETYYYGHDYSKRILDDRLARLEKTIYKYCRSTLAYKLRFQDLYKSFNSKTSPFEPKRSDKPLYDNKLLLVNFMETRLFGYEKKNLPLNERISQLELAVFGTEMKGSIDDRFDHLTKSTPLNIKGITISQNGTEIASFKPDTKPVPVPTSPYQNNFTPLNIQYDNQQGDYFARLGKNSSGEILRWKDFPVYIYIHSNNPYELSISKAAIDIWKNKLPVYETQNYQTADILIDWASKGDFISVPLLTKDGNIKHIKVLINLLDITKTEDKSLLLVFVTHQLGHALGIWGHSDNKDDLMYPIGKVGTNDINLRNKMPETTCNDIILNIKSPKISTRDLNTLFRVYQTPTSMEKIINNW